MKWFTVRFVCACIFCPTVLSASENLIRNGGFEQSNPGLVYAGENMDGWLVGGPDRVRIWWDEGNAVEGRQYLDMQGEDTISQVVNLQPGRDYSLKLHTIATTDQPRDPRLFQIDVISQYPADTLGNSRLIGSPVFAVTYFSSSGSANLTGHWTEYSVEFTAYSQQERLIIRNPLYSGHNWFLLDNVSLVEVPVPEPLSIVLVSVAVVGMLGRRFNRAAR